MKWTKEKKLDLLVNFYELSIDEARERYGASYKAIAGRLENLYDTEEPDLLELLIEASNEVKRRKGILPSSTPESRKEKRIMAKINKLQRKLAKVRGEQNE